MNSRTPISLAVVFFVSISSTASLSDGKMGIGFSPERVAELGLAHSYQFSENGEFIGGPSAPNSDQIDFSPLFGVEFNQDLLKQALFRCRPLIRYCDNGIRRFPSRELEVRVLSTSRLVADERIMGAIRAEFEASVGSVGFSWSVSNSPEHINIYIGGFESVASLASFRHPEARTFYSEIRPARPPASLLGLGTCFVAMNNFGRTGIVEIFLAPRDIELCLGRSLFVSLGLNEVSGEFSSILSVSAFSLYAFGYPSFFHRMAVSILYDDEFPIGGDPKLVEDYLAETVPRYYDDYISESVNE